MQHKDNNGRNPEGDNCLKLSIFTSDKHIKQLNIFLLGPEPVVVPLYSL